MKVIIMRGISGSGKSTAAKMIRDHVLDMEDTVTVCSADDFFITEGKYSFDPKKIGAAHSACKTKFKNALENEVDVVIVDNTNTQIWEYQPYMNTAVKYGYDVLVKIIGDPKDWESVVGRNVHGVPTEVLRKQSERFEF